MRNHCDDFKRLELPLAVSQRRRLARIIHRGDAEIAEKSLRAGVAFQARLRVLRVSAVNLNFPGVNHCEAASGQQNLSAAS